jgi:uncharacterized tellurite resistance protein B-like protein
MNAVEMLKNLMVMAAADQRFTEEEIAFLVMRSSRWGISDEQFDEALKFATSSEAKISIPDTHSDRVELLQQLLQMMAADGELAPVEKRLFAEASARMGISGDELDRLIDDLV